MLEKRKNNDILWKAYFSGLAILWLALIVRFVLGYLLSAYGGFFASETSLSTSLGGFLNGPSSQGLMDFLTLLIFKIPLKEGVALLYTWLFIRDKNNRLKGILPLAFYFGSLGLLAFLSKGQMILDIHAAFSINQALFFALILSFLWDYLPVNWLRNKFTPIFLVSFVSMGLYYFFFFFLRQQGSLEKMELSLLVPLIGAFLSALCLGNISLIIALKAEDNKPLYFVFLASIIYFMIYIYGNKIAYYHELNSLSYIPLLYSFFGLIVKKLR